VRLAAALLENLSWSELKKEGLVPLWALNPGFKVNPESAVESFADFCEQRPITADELDRYIKERLREHTPSMMASYEITLAENQDENSERRRLRVRSWFLVKMFGPEALTGSHQEFIAAKIAAITRAEATPVPAAQTAIGGTLNTARILSVELENIRCFRSLLLDFSENEKPRPWTILLGDNGLGRPRSCAVLPWRCAIRPALPP